MPDYDQALELTPRDADAFCGRGWVYAQTGDYDAAIREYDHALQINPAYVRALADRRMAYKQKGDYLRAMGDSGHLLWLRFGVLRITICLFVLTVAVALALGLCFKRIRADSSSNWFLLLLRPAPQFHHLKDKGLQAGQIECINRRAARKSDDSLGLPASRK
ncbi:MAG: tetratricopeptide repeat protein [Candidatus Acidiferrum sp.]